MTNQVLLSGVLVSKQATRYTPAGFEVFEGTFHHRTRLMEGQIERTVEFDFSAVAYRDVAHALQQLPRGKAITIRGFFAPRSMRSTRLIVHITEFNLRS